MQILPSRYEYMDELKTRLQYLGVRVGVLNRPRTVESLTAMEVGRTWSPRTSVPSPIPGVRASK